MTRKDKFKLIRKKKAVMLSLVLLLIFSAGVTIAYLVSQTDPVVNTFSPSVVDVEITEEFDGKVKKNVNVKNTGDTEAYIRVKLISYRVSESELDEDGKPVRIGGDASVPDFSLGTNWVKHKGFYYYTQPVAPEESPANPLIGETGIKLQEAYNDADGGKQVIEVMAEGIQSEPKDAVKEAWGQEVFDLLGGGE